MVTVWLLVSNAVTVTEKGDPIPTEPGAETLKWVAGRVVTVTVAEPVIDEVTVSVATTVWLPLLFRVTLNVPTPLLRVELAGRTASPSELVKCTVPA